MLTIQLHVAAEKVGALVTTLRVSRLDLLIVER